MNIVYLGIDLGTTNTKVISVSPEGKYIATASKPTEWLVKPNGRVEAIAEELFKKILECIAEVLLKTKAMLDSPHVAGIGITGMAESGIILSKQGKILAQPIAWFDARGEAEMNSLGEEFRKEYQSKTGLVFKAESSLSSLLSLKSEGFDFSQGGIVWLNVLEYIAFCFTGTQATEPSLASRTALYDQSTLSLWKNAQKILGINESFIPEQRFAGESWGTISSTNFQSEIRGAVVTVAGHDHGVGAAGSGATGSDQLFNSAGTADVVFRSVPKTLQDEQRFALTEFGVSAGRHSLQGVTSLIGGSRGGLVLRRALDLLGARSGEKLEAIDNAWKADRTFHDVIDMTQTRSISNDIQITLTGDAGPEELWAAALDYMAGENSKMLKGIDAVVGSHKSALSAGGWIKLRSVREMKSSVIHDLNFSQIDEAGAFGAAYMVSWAHSSSGESLIEHINQRVKILNSEFENLGSE
jgi:sugar (pentulose or hexulose) kinase